MNTNNTRCIDMQYKNVVKEFKLGNTTVKFCSDCIAKAEEERKMRIKIFKENFIKLIEKSNKKGGE